LTLCEEKVVNHFKFNGQQYGPISQQYYLRARYYNSVIVRFTQEDTYRGDGLNLYAYCRNNPVYYRPDTPTMPGDIWHPPPTPAETASTLPTTSEGAGPGP